MLIKDHAPPAEYYHPACSGFGFLHQKEGYDMRRWIVCLLALVLAGCWMSKRPDIPVSELVQPPGLPGRYWTISIEESASEPGLIEFRRDADGAMIGDVAGHSGGGKFRLVSTSIPGIYLKIIDNDEESVYYGFLEHRDLGAWQEYGIAPIDDDVFAGPDLVWMQQLADRCDLALDASDSDQTAIGGQIHGLAIPSLFSDPAFLATLEVQPVQLFLPAPPAPEEREELFPQGGYSFGLQLDQPDLLGAQWVVPAGLEGQYYIESPIGISSRPVVARFVRLPDGRFEIRSARPQDASARPQVLGVLPLKGVENEYLLVSFDHWKYEDRESHYLSLSILSRREAKWSISAIRVRGTEKLLGRQDLLSQPMTEAAQRQGATLDEFRLRGGMTAQSLLALLQDGQFTTGLNVNREGARYFGFEDEGNAETPASQ